MKPKDVQDNNITKYVEKFNKRDPRFNIGDPVRISKYENIFAKGYTPNWSREVFIVNKIKNTIPWTHEINDLNNEEIIRSFYEKELQRTAELSSLEHIK